MVRRVTASFVAVAALLAACSPIADHAPRILGWLSTHGMVIVDERGSSVRLLSIGIGGLHAGSGLPGDAGRRQTGCPGWRAPDQATYANVARFGFNSVRLAISWANLEPEPPTVTLAGTVRHSYNLQYLRTLDAVLAGFRSKGIAVVLDMAQFGWSPAFRDIPTKSGHAICQGIGMPAWLYPNAASETPQRARCDFFAGRRDTAAPSRDPQADFAAAWRVVARRYAEDPTVVGADVINEPYFGGSCGPSDLRLDRFYARIGAAIRSVNPRILLFIEDSQAGPGRPSAVGAPPSFGNAVYSFHLYVDNWRPQGLQRANVYVRRAQRWQMPLWIGEFNRFGPLGRPPPPGWQQQMGDMLSYCRKHGIGWDYWAYRAPNAPLVDGNRPDSELLSVLQSGF